MKPILSIAGPCAALAIVAASCGGQARPDLVVSSDPELGAMAAALLPDLAARSGMELREPVRLELRSRSELITYLQYKLDEELPEEEARSSVQAYALMGLVEPGLDLRALLLELYTEQVAGFYEPDSTALFVLDDQPEEALQALLVHELVHAVQDQTADLDALTDPDVGSDRATAAQAAIEGHATLVMFEYLTEEMTGVPIDLAQIPDFGAQMRPALEAMNSQFPALSGAPRIVRESLLFPYLDGAAFVQRLWQAGTRSNPFGADLPLSTEQILHPAAAPPLDVALDVGDATVVYDDVLGRLELGVLLEDVLGLASGANGPAAAVADGWDGDRYALVRDAGGDVSVVSVIVWDDATARDAFVRAVEASQGRFGGPTSIEPTEIEGRAATLLRVGSGRFDVETSIGSASR